MLRGLIGIRIEHGTYGRSPEPPYLYGRSHCWEANYHIYYPVPICYITRLVMFVWDRLYNAYWDRREKKEKEQNWSA